MGYQDSVFLCVTEAQLLPACFQLISFFSASQLKLSFSAYLELLSFFSASSSFFHRCRTFIVFFAYSSQLCPSIFDHGSTPSAVVRCLGRATVMWRMDNDAIYRALHVSPRFGLQPQCSQFRDGILHGRVDQGVCGDKPLTCVKENVWHEAAVTGPTTTDRKKGACNVTIESSGR